jgi:RNA polymerase sigma factor (sigma-70 family)
MEPIRVLLVDDHTLFRKGLASLLSTQDDIKVVGEASNGHEAVEKARSLMPDLILMDIWMPKCNGLEATKLIKGEMPYVKIVILTISDDDYCLFEAIKAGAQGYLLKNLEPSELFSLIRGVIRGEAPISRSLAARILDEFARNFKKDENLRKLAPGLTNREKEVLKLLVEGKSNKEIANHLEISENTVKNHLRNIMEKLHLQNRVQLAVYALKKGIVK